MKIKHIKQEVKLNILGSPGTGKTGIILNLVERSSFGHGEPLGKGK